MNVLSNRWSQRSKKKVKTVGLLLRLAPELWGNGKGVALDSRFCVLKELVELLKAVVFPKFIPGDEF
jgi:Transposase IS4